MGPFGGVMFDIFPIAFFTIFAIVILVFIVAAARGVAEWNRNNHSPVLTVDARVVSKRTSVSHHHHNNDGMNHMHSSTSF